VQHRQLVSPDGTTSLSSGLDRRDRPSRGPSYERKTSRVMPVISQILLCCSEPRSPAVHPSSGHAPSHTRRRSSHKEQHVHPGQPDRLYREEVARQDPGRPGSEGTRPSSAPGPPFAWGPPQAIVRRDVSNRLWPTPSSELWRTRPRSAGSPARLPGQLKTSSNGHDRGPSETGAYERRFHRRRTLPMPSATASPASPG